MTQIHKFKVDSYRYTTQDELKRFPHILSIGNSTPYPNRSVKTIVLGELPNPKDSQQVMILSVEGREGEGKGSAGEIAFITELRNIADKHSHDAITAFCSKSLMELYHHIIESHEKDAHDQEAVSELIIEFRNMLNDANEKKASDIHIEVRRGKAQIRYRIDGELSLQKELSRTIAERLVTAIYSVEAEEQDVTFNKDTPQDAIIDRVVGGQRLRVRLATLPASPDGFDCIMRLLPIGEDSATILELHELGYSAEQIEMINMGLMNPTGAIIIAGTTGSGKSTTLKHMLGGKIEEGQGAIKVITVEDPPEYAILGATQVPVSRNRKTNSGESSFAAAIRAAMRSDPDILMVGEVRDGTSATLLVNAVESGHQCYTTVHAASALGIIGRLNSMGVSKEVLGSDEFIACLIYQALLPKLCLHCRKPLDLMLGDPKLRRGSLERIRAVANPNSQIYIRGDGCDKCNRGISGKTVVAEVILPDNTLLRHFSSGARIDALEYWLENGGKRIIEHGISKMLEGIVSPTDVEDILGPMVERMSVRQKNNFPTDLLSSEKYAIMNNIVNYSNKESTLSNNNEGIFNEKDPFATLEKELIMSDQHDPFDETEATTIPNKDNPFGLFETEHDEGY